MVLPIAVSLGGVGASGAFVPLTRSTVLADAGSSTAPHRRTGVRTGSARRQQGNGGGQSSSESLAQLIAATEGVSEQQARLELDRVVRALREVIGRGDEVWLFGLGRFEQHDRKRRCRKKSCAESTPRRVVRFIITDELRRVIEARTQTGRSPSGLSD